VAGSEAVNRVKSIEKEDCMKPRSPACLLAVTWWLVFMVACQGGDNSGAPPALVDGSTHDTFSPPPDSGGNDTGSGQDASGTGGDTGASDATVADAGFTLPLLQPPLSGPPGPGQLLLTASGESLALSGYNFPAAHSGDPVFADGWEVLFDHFIATFDKVTLWSNPDMVPTDQSMHGPLIAEKVGPWAVDLSLNAASFPYIDGKELGERAVAFAVIDNQNKNGNAPFPTDGTRFAVGFSEVVATPQAMNVNLGPAGLALYQSMIQKGCVALYVGQATWKGDQGLCNGTPSDAGAGGIGQEPEFTKIPPTVRFELCFKPRAQLPAGSVETSYINCDNQDNDPAMPLNSEPHQRGIAFKANTYSVGEVTFHTDHPFWESTKHDTPARFDPFAAQMTGGGDGGIPTVHMDDVIGVDYTGFKDKQGNLLPWRTCDPNYANPNGGSRSGQMHFDPVAVPHCTNNDPSTGLCDYYDYSKYNQSTQGHWNGADGLCFVQRNYPSPP
jgi:hypothetical protein